jgi:6-pyruvoyltetrahydropterin/6-carboxytetrahydropterin synthase
MRPRIYTKVHSRSSVIVHYVRIFNSEIKTQRCADIISHILFEMMMILYHRFQAFFIVALLVVTQVVNAGLPFKLGVRDSLMIAHSFHNHPSFGPAGGMHGATYTCDVEFSRGELDEDCNWVIDIGKASDILSEVLAKYNLKNLDEIFGDGVLTTTEFMCREICKGIGQRVREEVPNFRGSLGVKLWESHKAWASYEESI